MKRNALIVTAVILLGALVIAYAFYQVKGKTIGDEWQRNAKETAGEDTRKIVWEQLSEHQKEEVDGTWTDGKASRITLNENAVVWATNERSYAGEEVYLISFPSKMNASIGDLIIYADINTSKIIGYGMRD